jgi:hypothetical protein
LPHGPPSRRKACGVWPASSCFHDSRCGDTHSSRTLNQPPETHAGCRNPPAGRGRQAIERRDDPGWFELKSRLGATHYDGGYCLTKEPYRRSRHARSTPFNRVTNPSHTPLAITSPRAHNTVAKQTRSMTLRSPCYLRLRRGPPPSPAMAAEHPLHPTPVPLDTPASRFRQPISAMPIFLTIPNKKMLPTPRELPDNSNWQKCFPPLIEAPQPLFSPLRPQTLK